MFHYINNEEHESKTAVACKWNEASKRGRMKYKGRDYFNEFRFVPLKLFFLEKPSNT